jgi:hypothetical protein
METRQRRITLWDNVLPQTVTSSTDATPIVITKVGHGYTTGQLIMIQGHTTNIAANGIFKIVVLSSSTFALYDQFLNTPIVGSGAGAGSGGVMVVAPAIMWTDEFRTQTLQIMTSGSFTGTIKIAISQGISPSLSSGPGMGIPNFGATVTPSNPYSLAQLIPLDTTTPVNGATGIASAGTDLAENYEINTNSQKYACPLLTAWAAGRITLVANLTNQL